MVSYELILSWSPQVILQVNVPPAPCGEAKIEVTFNIDVSGIVYMFAKDAITGEEKDLEEDPLFGCDIITEL